MAVEVTMPQMGADMTEGTVVKWLKAVGDQVERGEIIAEIETDKANIDLEAYESGTLLKIVVEEGELAPVGDVIAILGAEDEAVDEPKRRPPAESPARRAPETAEVAQASRDLRRSELEAADDSSGKRIRISPVARRIAVENDFDYRGLKGSGPGGRILRRDIEAALESKQPETEEAEPPTPETAAAATEEPQADTEQAAAAATETEDVRDEKAKDHEPAPEAEEEEEQPAARATARPAREAEAPVEGLSRIRRTIARRMSQSKQQQPHYYLTLDIDMTDAMAFRKGLNEQVEEDGRVTVNDLIVKACALAIERHPKFNASFTDDGLRRPEEINIDIGIALDEGLIAPSLLDVGDKSLGRIARDSKDLVQRAREGHLRADEYGNGTFTITNLGNYGVETLIGIINPPQAAILGVGSVMEQAVVRNSEIVIRQMMKVALSADHRVTDGAEGARFIKEIQRFLETPVLLSL